MEVVIIMSTHGKNCNNIKLEAMRLHFLDDVGIKEISARYGVAPPTVYGWRAQYRKYGEDAFIGCGQKRAAASELQKLRSANDRLRYENRYLAKQLGYLPR
jgi:transposase-like protein